MVPTVELTDDAQPSGSRAGLWITLAVVAAAVIGGVAFKDKLFGASAKQPTSKTAPPDPQPVDDSRSASGASPQSSDAGEPPPSGETGPSDADAPTREQPPALSEEQLAQIDTDLASARRWLRGYGRKDKALEVTDKILAIAPDHAQTLVLRAEILVNMKRREEALAAVTRAKLANPELPEVFLILGAILQETDDKRGALEAYERYLELDSSGDQATAVKTTVNQLRRELDPK